MRNKGFGKAFKKVGVAAPHLLQGLPGLSGPRAPPTFCKAFPGPRVPGAGQTSKIHPQKSDQTAFGAEPFR